MRTIAHISDLHFGKEDTSLGRELLASLERAQPSLVVISGDLTHGARPWQFEQARSFIDSIGAPTLVVPGNHDIPAYNVVRRFLRPLHAYRTHITDDLAPAYSDDEMIVVGLNTARARTLKEGRVSRAQLRDLHHAFSQFPQDHRVRIVVSHHPVVIASARWDRRKRTSIRKPVRVINACEACAVDLFLSGHVHRTLSGDVRAHHPGTRRPMVAAQAGAALSRWHLKEPNAYNIVSIHPHQITVSYRCWDAGSFVERESMTFARKQHACAPSNT